jgi:hypothetical protein
VKTVEKLRCIVAEVRWGVYRAECIDLDLATDGASVRDAMLQLNDAVSGYLMVVCGDVGTNESFPAIECRPSPWIHRLLWYFPWSLHVKRYRNPIGLTL